MTRTRANLKPLDGYREYPVEEMRRRAMEFLADMRRRRTIRSFSERPIPRDIIEHCVGAAGTAPSGANLQPWHFVVVCDPEIKHHIREAAEAEEREFYGRRAPKEWLEVLEPLGTDEHKPFLEVAPYIIAVFVKNYERHADGRITKYYYALESVAIAAGILVTALHHAGLATLTHTPSPMAFLNQILGRPNNERPVLLLVVGYPADDAAVPDLSRKSLEEIATFL